MNYRPLFIGFVIGIAIGVSGSVAWFQLTRPNINLAMEMPKNSTDNRKEQSEYVFIAVTLGDQTEEIESLLTANNISAQLNGEGFGNWFSVPSHSKNKAIELLEQNGYKKFVDDARSWDASDE